MLCPTCCQKNLPGNEVCTHCGQSLAHFDLPQPDSIVERSLMTETMAVLKPNTPTVISRDATARQALALMLDQNVGALLVVDDEGRLVGILTERDFLKKVAGVHAEYNSLPVESLMTPRPETVGPTDTLNYALQKMDAGGYRHIPIVSAGKPIGMVSVRDMIRHITRLCRDEK